MKNFVKILLIPSLVLGLASVSHAKYLSDKSRGKKDVANYLMNFARFIKWPGSAFSGGDFNVCIIGDNPLGGAVKKIEGKKANDRKIKIMEMADASGAASCQIVYVAPSMKGSEAGVLGAVGGKPILTVSELAGFTKGGGMLMLRPAGKNIAIGMVKGKITEAGLEISSKLMKAIK